MFKKYITKFYNLEKTFYQKSVDAYFDRDYEKDVVVYQKQHPKDDFGRSIAQDKCQTYPFKKDLFKLNCIAVLLGPILMVGLLMKRRFYVKESDNSSIVCFSCLNLPGALPEALSNKAPFFLKTSDCSYYLRTKDISFLLRFFIRSIGSPFLALRVLLRVSKFRAIIDSFSQLEAIVLTREFDATSSTLTQYCHENGVKLYNFMQGEAFCSPRTSFFHFDKCFVWDQHYADSFVRFGAIPEQFEVSTPRCLQTISGVNVEQIIDYTYYLSGDPDEELPIIGKAIAILASKGFRCAVRPHPRWSNMEMVNKSFKGIEIQDTSSVSIDESILMTKNAISLYSTVLIQAYHNGIIVVIDDLSAPAKYKNLEQFRYIMLNKPHLLLSELIKS